MFTVSEERRDWALIWWMWRAWWWTESGMRYELGVGRARTDAERGRVQRLGVRSVRYRRQLDELIRRGKRRRHRPVRCSVPI